MENSFSAWVEKSKQAIKYWWLMMLLGIALFVIGIVVFLYPAESYLSLSIVFGIMILVSGISGIVLSASNKHYITGRGWMLASGIIETVLGLILTCNVALSAVTMPIFLGFWLMFRAFATIGGSGELISLKIPGATWTLIGGILLLLLSIWILLQPLAFGTAMVVVWVGISLLFSGITTFIFSLQLKNIHRYIA